MATKSNRDSIGAFYSIAEVAERLGVNARTVRRWIGDGRLVVHRFGRSIRIAETDLRAFMAANREG